MRASSFCPEIHGRLDANAIEHQTSATWAGDLLNPLSGFACVPVVDNLVRAERMRLFELLVVHVCRHDAQRREHTQKLDGHVSEATHAEDDNRTVRIEVRQCSFDGVIRCQCSVAQRSRFGRTHVAQRYKQPYGWYEHVLGHPRHPDRDRRRTH